MGNSSPSSGTLEFLPAAKARPRASAQSEQTLRLLRARERSLVDILWLVATEGHVEQSSACIRLCKATRSDALLWQCIVNTPQPKGRSSLFWAVEAGDVPRALWLIQAGADVRAKDADDRTTLSIACGYSGSGHRAMVSALLGAWPEGVKVKGNRGFFPLQWACKNNAPTGVILALLHAWPEGARELDWRGFLPLHRACKTKASVEVISALIEAYPAGLRVKDHTGDLPLHNACKSRRPVEVVQALLSAWPESAQVPDQCNDLALHRTCKNPVQPLEVVAAVLAAWPEGIKYEGFSGFTPLHQACRNNAPLEIVSLLLDAWPAGALHLSPGGFYPLYWSCKITNAPLEVIELLRTAQFGHGLPEQAETIEPVARVELHREVAASWTSSPLHFLLFAWHELARHCTCACRRKWRREGIKVA